MGGYGERRCSLHLQPRGSTDACSILSTIIAPQMDCMYDFNIDLRRVCYGFIPPYKIQQLVRDLQENKKKFCTHCLGIDLRISGSISTPTLLGVKKSMNYLTRGLDIMSLRMYVSIGTHTFILLNNLNFTTYHNGEGYPKQVKLPNKWTISLFRMHILDQSACPGCENPH